MNVGGVDLSYAFTPFFAWLTAGSLKFLVNSAKAKKWAFGQIGYGGLPSNHSAVVSSMAALVAIREGISHPAFGVAVTVAFVVILDAGGLRRQVGRIAAEVNRLSTTSGSTGAQLRERMGHTSVEIAAGAVVGTAVAYFAARVF